MVDVQIRRNSIIAVGKSIMNAALCPCGTSILSLPILSMQQIHSYYHSSQAQQDREKIILVTLW